MSFGVFPLLSVTILGGLIFSVGSAFVSVVLAGVLVRIGSFIVFVVGGLFVVAVHFSGIIFGHDLILRSKHFLKAGVPSFSYILPGGMKFMQKNKAAF